MTLSSEYKRYSPKVFFFLSIRNVSMFKAHLSSALTSNHYMNMFNTIGCVNTVHALSYSYGATTQTIKATEGREIAQSICLSGSSK